MGGYVLYGWRQTGSLAIEAALREVGADYSVMPVDTSKKEQWSESFKAINPRQQLPALVLPDSTVVTEGPAILLCIADSFPDAKLIPAAGTTERATLCRWLLFFAVNVYEGELRKCFPDRYIDDPALSAHVAAAANAYVERHYLIFEGQLGHGPYFMGGNFTILDIYVWMLAQWMDAGWLARHCPKVLALADAVKARPRIRAVHDSHFGD